MSPATPEPAGLKREIGLFGATALGIGAIIGSGIFIVTGIVAGIAGPAMIISVLIAGIIALFSAFSVAELSAYLPEEGGTYAFAQKLISPFAGFIAGWIWIFSNIFVGAAVSLGFAHYFVTLFPTIPVKGIAVIICLIFIIINFIGLKESTLLNNILVTLKVLILLFFVAFGLGYFSGSHFTPFAPTGISGILSGAALIFFAYTGFARVTIMAEEVQDPEKTIPRSIYLALAISTVLYILVSVIAVGLVGTSSLSQSGSPLADAIGVTGSPVAVLLISLGAMTATASVLLTTIMGISRIMFAMARTGDLPAFLNRIHPHFSTPYYAIWISGACMIAAILLADLTLVVAVSTFAMLVFYLIANIAAFRIPLLYRKYPPIVPVIGAVSCIGLIGFLTSNAWMIGMIGLAMGIAWYGIQRRIAR
jgi:basic amino acid/polyamine antiporter, APA family